MSNAQKIPFAASLQNAMSNRIDDSLQGLGQVLPCSVTEVNGAIVTVNFDINNSVFTPPPAIVPTMGSRYLRLPIQIGDTGICIASNARLGGITGLGLGVAPLISPTNLGGLVFVPIGNVNWELVDSNAFFFRDASESITVTGVNGLLNVDGNMSVSGNLSAGNGITCMFTTLTGQTVTVQNGIITNLF